MAESPDAFSCGFLGSICVSVCSIPGFFWIERRIPGCSGSCTLVHSQVHRIERMPISAQEKRIHTSYFATASWMTPAWAKPSVLPYLPDHLDVYAFPSKSNLTELRYASSGVPALRKRGRKPHLDHRYTTLCWEPPHHGQYRDAGFYRGAIMTYRARNAWLQYGVAF